MIEKGGMSMEGVNAYASTESVWSSSNFGRARRMFIFNAAVSANSPRQREYAMLRGTHVPMVGS
jgi:hypothetical protein